MSLSSVTVCRCGVSSAKSCGGNAARKRLDRPRSSCRGGVPYGIRRHSCVKTATRVHQVTPKCPEYTRLLNEITTLPWPRAVGAGAVRIEFECRVVQHERERRRASAFVHRVALL